MGSFVWDDPCYLQYHNDVQYHNGRPLSSALIAPCNCQSEIQSCNQSDFAIQCRPRSQSSGRRYKRESYRIYHPNVSYASFCYSPPFQRRFIDHSASRDCFLGNLETVFFEEERCRPNYRCVQYVRNPSPIVRHVKIRSRPSSCVDLRKKEGTNNQWTKVVEERHDEHYDYHYNYNLPVERSVPISRSSTRDAATETDAIPKKPIRPLSISETQVLDRYETDEIVKRDATAETRTITYTTSEHKPLFHSYTTSEQKPYYHTYATSEQNASLLTNATSEQNASLYKYTTSEHKPFLHSYTTTSEQKPSLHTYTTISEQKPLLHTYTATSEQKPLLHTYTATSEQRPLLNTYTAIDGDGDDESEDKHYKKGSTKIQRKEFMQRMHVRNGTASKGYNSSHLYSDFGNNQVIVRQTAKPREAIVDAPSIIAPIDDFGLSTPLTYESSIKSRNYYKST